MVVQGGEPFKKFCSLLISGSKEVPWIFELSLFLFSLSDAQLQQLGKEGEALSKPKSGD